MPGMVETVMNQEDDQINVPQQVTEGAYQASTIDVPHTDTMQGKVEDIISGGGSLLELARTRAAQTANDRGLLNTSMAAGAGERAVIETAMPIASQDAQTAFNTRLANAAAENQSLHMQAGTEAQSRLMGEQTGHQSRLMGEQAGYDQILQQMRGDQAERITMIETQNQMMMQNSQSAAVLFANTMASVGDILANPDIPNNLKQGLVDQQISLLESGLALMGGIGNIDMGGLLGFGTPTGGTATGELTQEQIDQINQDLADANIPGQINIPDGLSESEINDLINEQLGGTTTGGTTTGGTQLPDSEINNMVMAAYEAHGSEPNEEFIMSSLTGAAHIGGSTTEVYAALSPFFPDVSYEQFLQEVLNRGFQIDQNTMRIWPPQ